MQTTGEPTPKEQSHEILILVDDKDNQIGTDTRENCHLGKGRRHRAYVVFLFCDKKVLLQRRSQQKALFPGYWDVSFTSHVYPGETYYEAAARKGIQELDAKFERLVDVYSFVYTAPFGRWSENEFCRVLIGDFDGKMRPNPDEISDTKYMTVEELGSELRRRPDQFTPWLKLAFEGFMEQDAAKKYI
jgi:isopentenyl-diphosphate Delta-isomerase